MTILLQANNINLEIQDRKLLEIEQLQIHQNDRIGIVGKNGAGKSTLLHILAGKTSTENCSIQCFGTMELIPQLKNTNTTKSGGEVTQAYITEAIQGSPALLMADEPTTNLDTEHVEWLENKLKHWQGALLLVSHDRAFLDSLCTKIWELKDGKITEYPGNYSFFAAQKNLERLQHEQSYEQYTKKKRQLEDALTMKRSKASKATKKPKGTNLAEARNSKPYFAKKQKKLDQTAKALKTRIEKLEKIDKPFEEKRLVMSVPNEEQLMGRVVLRAERFSGVIGGRTLWSPTSFHLFAGEKIGLIGPNGSGKTTLLKKILDGDNGIYKSPAMKIGYFRQNLTMLNPAMTIMENVQEDLIHDETTIRTVLARLHFRREDVYKKVEVLSGGERVKVALAKVFLSDVNTLVLDEPTNFLDLEALEAFEDLLIGYPGTLLFVSHDRRFLQKVAKRIICIKEKQIHLFDGTYDEWMQHDKLSAENKSNNERQLQIENRLAEVISLLSIQPTPQLDAEFQRLLKEKNTLQ